MNTELLLQLADEYGEFFPDSDVVDIKHFIEWVSSVMKEEGLG